LQVKTVMMMMDLPSLLLLLKNLLILMIPMLF
jgi:hypothetical protein